MRPVARAATAALDLMPHSVRERIAQSLTDGRLVRSRRSAALRRALTRGGNEPTVELDLLGTRLELPLSHALPTYRRAFPGYAENLGKVARLVADRGGRTMIDVGANVGDSAAIVKAYAPEMAILCVDADAAYLPFLRANTARWSDVEIAAPVLLAERSEEIPGGVHGAHGTSRFVSSSDAVASAVSLDDLLREHGGFSAPALLKSDTDGFEDQVLKGATSLLGTTGPALFLEYDPRLLGDSGANSLAMLEGLRSFGYERIAFYDKFGKLMIRCSLSDTALLGDLDAYAAGNTEQGIDHYDVVVVTPEFSSVIDELTAEPAS